jgi:multidrug efflux pump subunit AcrA (membrane-fusion protein)
MFLLFAAHLFDSTVRTVRRTGTVELSDAVTGWSRRTISEEAEIEGQLVGLFASMQARVERVLAREYQLIAQGDVLIVLEHRELDAQLKAAAADLPSAPLAGRSSRAGRVGPFTLSQAHAILGNGSQKAVLDRVEPAPMPARARKARQAYRLASLKRDTTNLRAPVAGRVISSSTCTPASARRCMSAGALSAPAWTASCERDLRCCWSSQRGPMFRLARGRAQS